MVDQVARNAPNDDEKFAIKAWICLPRDSFPRKQCITIVENPWFDRAVLLLIAINCITMTVRRGCYTPPLPSPSPSPPSPPPPPPP